MNEICDSRSVLSVDSSVDRALHRYRKVMGSSPVKPEIFSGCFF